MQIKLNKPLTDLNHLLMRNNLQPTPKRSSLINQNPSKNHKENQLNVANMSRSPARSASIKAINSKDDSLHSLSQNENSRNRAKSRRVDQMKRCQNHEDRQGSFHITIQGQDLYYCEKCALKLKSQGFPIRQAHQDNANQDHSHPGSYHKNNLLPAYSHFEGNPLFGILKTLLSKIYESQQKMLNSKMNNQFFTQLETNLDHFYDGIEQMVKVKRQSSRAELELAKQRLNGCELTQTIGEIKIMKQDIEQNIESILVQVQEDAFYQCVQSIQERLSVLNKVGQYKWLQFQKLKHKYQRFLQDQALSLQQEIKNLQSHSVSVSSQKVINSQADDMLHFQEGMRGPFKNPFNQDKVKRRLISRK